MSGWVTHWTEASCFLNKHLRVSPAMLPGYGLSSLPDFQPHLHTYPCQGESLDMWIPGSPESQALSEARKDRPFLGRHHDRHNHHPIAVYQQETLTFIELQQTDPSALGSSPSERGHLPPSPQPLSWTGSWFPSSEVSSISDVTPDADLEFGGTKGSGSQERSRTDSQSTEIPKSTPTASHRPTPPVSLPLSNPLTSLPSDWDSLHSPGSPTSCPTSSLGFRAQSPDTCRLQRRASQGALKEKSIRRKMRVYSSESPCENSLGRPSRECEYFFPGPFKPFLEEDLRVALPELSMSTSPTPLEERDRDPQSFTPLIPNSLPGQTLETNGQTQGEVLCGGVVLESPTPNGAPSASRPVDQERRRFSASELISRLQLTQRKSSFTLKLGKSLSARVASRDRPAIRSLSPDNKSSFRRRSSAGSSDSSPHSPVGSCPPLPSADCNIPLQRRGSRLSVRNEPIEEDVCTPPSLNSAKRLSRYLPSSILYQEYSDVAIDREIKRQQGAEPGTEEEALGGEETGEALRPGSLSPTSSFCSSRGSAFSLWQDIPDVRTSGMLDTFSNEERKLQEAKFELVTSEASYIRSLTIAVDHFMLSPELGECLGAQERQWLFSKLPDVKDVSERFLQDLEHRLEEDILRFDVCDIVLAHCPALRKVYLPYVTNQAYQEQTYQRLLQESPRFRSILARLEEDPICQRLPLSSFIILPFQRITRLKMLVENILKSTTPGSRDEDTATKAFNELKKLIKECNSSVQSMKRTEELIHLNKKIHFEGKIFPLISQSRWLVKDGELMEVDTQTMSISGSKLKLPTRPVYLHLFNDILLLSRRKDTWKFVVFVHAKIGELKVKDLSQKLQGISGFIFHLQLCEGQLLKHQIVLKAHTESEKQRWITAMFPSDLKVGIEQISENEDLCQVQCIRSYQALENDELALEKADILQAKTITSDGWVEGIRLSDGERGWFPRIYVEEISSRSARLRNLRENNRIKCATQRLED